MYDLLQTYELPSVVCPDSKLIAMLIVSQHFCLTGFTVRICPLSPTIRPSLWKVGVYTIWIVRAIHYIALSPFLSQLLSCCLSPYLVSEFIYLACWSLPTCTSRLRLRRSERRRILYVMSGSYGQTDLYMAMLQIDCNRLHLIGEMR